jgi:hypothetical protein
MGKIRRTLEKTSKDRSLFSEERKLLDSVSDAEKHIEGNMFKNEKGELNENLQKKYKKVSNSYAENVVPYLYNDDIQGYKDRKMRAKKINKLFI